MKKESSCLLLAFLIFTAVFSLIYGYFELGGNEMCCPKKICLALILILLGIFILMLIFCEEDSQPKIVFDKNALYENQEKILIMNEISKVSENEKCAASSWLKKICKKNIAYIGNNILNFNDSKYFSKIKKLYFAGEENKITVELFNKISGKAQIIICNEKPLEFYENEDNSKSPVYKIEVPLNNDNKTYSKQSATTIDINEAEYVIAVKKNN